MNKNEIKLHVKEIITKCLELTEISVDDDDNIIDELSINSIYAIGIFLMVEDEFHIQIDDEDLGVELISSINNLSSYIEKKKSGDN